MLKDQRRQKILEIVNEKDFVTNKQLAKLLSSTIQTIINDISELDKEKKTLQSLWWGKICKFTSKALWVIWWRKTTYKYRYKRSYCAKS
ncbi:HTH domain-containing protein [Mycoplasma capricolum]|uniref:HTH domain-containing protein n=1 Tax=Mycoplasma capricolum TaxID=2095 RepID=UPI003DA30630